MKEHRNGFEQQVVVEDDHLVTEVPRYQPDGHWYTDHSEGELEEEQDTDDAYFGCGMVPIQRSLHEYFGKEYLRYKGYSMLCSQVVSWKEEHLMEENAESQIEES